MAECNQVTVLIVVHETPACRDNFFGAGYILLIERRDTDLNCQSFLKLRHRKNSLSMENPTQYSASKLYVIWRHSVNNSVIRISWALW
jgi:hypothetical protein